MSSSPASDAPLAWRWLGELAHADAFALQLAVRAEVHAGTSPGVVLLATHPAVVTLGRAADRRNVLASDAELAALGVDVVATERGGDVTYHDPGQLMVYPVVRLRRGVVGFLEEIAEELAAIATACGVAGARFRREPAGLWLGDAKLAACGIHVARGVATHGYAFNVSTDAARWRLIRPCGLDVPLVSLADACAARGLPPPPPPATLAQHLGPALAARLR